MKDLNPVYLKMYLKMLTNHIIQIINKNLPKMMFHKMTFFTIQIFKIENIRNSKIIKLIKLELQ